MSSAELDCPTGLLQNCSKASLRALWKSEWLLKQSVTYCTQGPGSAWWTMSVVTEVSTRSAEW